MAGLFDPSYGFAPGAMFGPMMGNNPASLWANHPEWAMPPGGPMPQLPGSSAMASAPGLMPPPQSGGLLPPPLSLATPSPGPGAPTPQGPTQPGMLDRIGSALGGSGLTPAALLAFAGNTLSGGIGRGLSALGPAMQQGQQQNLQMRSLAATYQALIAKGVPPAEAQAATLNPEILKTVAAKYFETKPQFTTIGHDRYGQPVFGFVEPSSGKVTPINGSTGAPGSGALAAPGDASAANMTGDAFLATLDKPRADTVKAIVEGRQQPPTGMALKTPYFQQLMQDVAQYEPGFDLTRWTQRVATRKEFSAGGPNSPAGAITAGNTAIQHLGHLSDTAETLDNSSYPLFNSVVNFGREQTGDPRIAEFNSIRNKYIEEATKFYRGTGGNESDLQRDIATLNAAQSPQQLRAAIAAQSQLMQSKINALQDRWRTGMGPNAGDFPIIQSESQAALDRINKRANPQGQGPATLPDAARAQLQEGHQTTFGNGQVWTLANGQPQRVR